MLFFFSPGWLLPCPSRLLKHIAKSHPRASSSGDPRESRPSEVHEFSNAAITAAVLKTTQSENHGSREQCRCYENTILWSFSVTDIGLAFSIALCFVVVVCLIKGRGVGNTILHRPDLLVSLDSNFPCGVDESFSCMLCTLEKIKLILFNNYQGLLLLLVTALNSSELVSAPEEFTMQCSGQPSKSIIRAHCIKC